jgi:hypothetical protein
MKTYTAAELAEIIESHGKWLRGEKGGSRADLCGADLCGADLRSAALFRADLRSADLFGADLFGADLRGANLRGANLRSANLRSADLFGADLRGANLRSADLFGANLFGANLFGADLRCMGNMNNIKTIQADIWQVGYTHDTLQIGCQRHLIAEWQVFSDEEIGRMDSRALSWWEIWKPILMNIIEVSPANPTKVDGDE